jgi:D-glycero-alpha-D-manno-heptose-7-phosphate kinase
VAWLALTKRLMKEELTASDLAELAYRLEKLIGVEGGKQDQYAAALGGFNLLHFRAEDEPAAVEELNVPTQTVQTLQASCILCDAGPSPAAGSLHTEVWQRYRQGDATIARTLREIRDTVLPARDALLAGNVAVLASLITANREAARQFHPHNVTPHMDELFMAGESAGALGSKACGEGGGGCLLFLCPPGHRTAVENALRSRGGTLISFRFIARSEW